MLSREQFERTRRWALRSAGIELGERHMELLGNRGRRLGVLDGASFDALLDAAEGGDPGARQRLVSLLTTKFTGFFRHERHFELAAEHALWAVHRRGKARLWSAAAATGEEPYSLAMSVLEAFRDEAPPVAILATDIDAESLAFARGAEYGLQALEGVAPERRARFFAPAAGGRHVLAPAVHRLVQHQVLNLVEVSWAVDGPFDAIFCRNVLMYLEGCHRYAVLERLASLIAPDGILLIDPTEHLGKAVDLFEPGPGGVCSPRRASNRPRL